MSKCNEPEFWRELLSTSATRRRALELILGAAAGVAGASALRAEAPPRGPARAEPGPRVRVGRVEDLPPGEAKMVEYEGQPVLVFNRDGAIAAFSAICTHEGCIVDWSRSRGILLCPCHGGEYDTEGRVIAGPPPAPLLRFRTSVEDGIVYVDGIDE